MSFQREEATTDGSIQSFNFGGLNTTASRLNVPFTDATSLLNVSTSLDGTLLKRNGTVQLDTNIPGVHNYATTVRSVTGYTYTVCMRSGRIDIFSRRNNRSVLVRTSTISIPTQLTPTQWVHLPDTYSRVLGLSANLPPLEVYLVELQGIAHSYSTGSNTLTMTSREIKRFSGDNATFGNFSDTVYITRSTGAIEEYPGNSCTYSYTDNPGTTGTLTVTLPPGSPTTPISNVDIIGHRWAWWANSLKWQGDRFFDNISRFNVTANDNNVSVPSTLISDIKFGEETLFLEISKTYSRADNYALVDPPLTADQYSLSDGSTYVPGTNSFVNSAPYFVTFGLARTPFPQPAESIKFSRYRELRLANTITTLTNASNIRVTVNDIVVPANFTGTPTGGRGSSYAMYDSSGALVTSGSSQPKWLGFTSAIPVGVGATQVVTITNTQGLSASFLAVEVIESRFKSGAYRRSYGLPISLGTTTNGGNPTCGCVYQGRLVLGGVKTNKSTIVFSGVGADDDPYTNFQITDDLDGLPTDPFDVTVSGGDTADYIVGLVEWNNSLFTLTRRSVYRVNGGDAPINASRRLVTYISNIGLVNSRSIVRTDTAVYYLSDGGVFNLTPKVEDSEFTAVEKSLKVRGLITNRNPLKLDSALMVFDSKRRKLYVALPDNTDLAGESSDLMVFDTVRESWTRTRLLNGLRATSLVDNVDNVTGEYNIVASTATGHIMFDGDDIFVDRTSVYTGATSHTYSTPVGYAVDSVAEGQRYSIPAYILTLPYQQIQDLRVYVDDTEVGFTKYTDYIYLDTPTSAGSKVWFVARSPVNDSPQGASLYGTVTRYPYTLLKNGVEVLEATESIVFDDITNTATLTVSFSGSTSDVFRIGVHYPCNFTSAMFTQQVLGSLKRTKHAYLFFDNSSNNVLTSGQYTEGYATTVNVSVAMLYDSDDNDANTSIDIYGYRDILWDNAYFDTPESAYRQEAYTLFKEPLIGLGYSYRLAVFSYDSARWVLVGFQIDASNSKGLRYINTR